MQFGILTYFSKLNKLKGVAIRHWCRDFSKITPRYAVRPNTDLRITRHVKRIIPAKTNCLALSTNFSTPVQADQPRFMFVCAKTDWFVTRTQGYPSVVQVSGRSASRGHCVAPARSLVRGGDKTSLTLNFVQSNRIVHNDSA